MTVWELIKKLAEYDDTDVVEIRPVIREQEYGCPECDHEFTVDETECDLVEIDDIEYLHYPGVVVLKCEVTPE